MHWTSLSSADWDCPFHSEGKKMKAKGAHGCWNHEALPASYQHDWALNSLHSLSTLLALHSFPSTSKAFLGKLHPLCSSNSNSASASQQNNSVVPLPSFPSIKKDAPLLVRMTSAYIHVYMCIYTSAKFIKMLWRQTTFEKDKYCTLETYISSKDSSLHLSFCYEVAYHVSNTTNKTNSIQSL